MNNSAPNIYLLRSPTSYYFFDVNKNEIVATSKSAFYELDEILMQSPAEKEIKYSLELEEIKKAGYLSDHRPKIIKHPKTDLLPEFLENHIEQFTLQLTQDCNFRCTYCAYTSSRGDVQRHHTRKSMSYETAKKAIDFFYNHSKDSDTVSIGLYGGEPLLEFNLLKQVVQYVEYIFEGRNYAINVTTNGSMFNEEIIDFLLEHNIDVLISLDGPKEIHDKNRKLAATGGGTFDLVIGNIENIRAKNPEFFKKIRFNMVLDPSNDYDCYNQINIDYSAITRGSMNVSYLDENLMDMKIEVQDVFIQAEQYDTFLAYMSKLGRYKKEDLTAIAANQITNIEMAEKKMVRSESLFDIVAPGGPCLPGVLRTLVDVDGNLFPCERCSETSKVMRIGSLDKGFDIERANEILNVGKLTEEECRNCFALRSCSVCASVIEDGECLSVEKKLLKCEGIKFRAQETMLDLIMFNELQSV